MTLCELEIAHLSPPMECRQKSTITPTKRRHCVEWALFLSFNLYIILLTTSLGRWLGVPNLGPAIPVTSESRVSTVTFARTIASPKRLLARICYAYQQLNDVGTLVSLLLREPGTDAFSQT